jgi:hypothetical protein
MYSCELSHINPSNPVIAAYFQKFAFFLEQIVLQNIASSEYADVKKCILVALHDHFMAEKQLAHTSYEVSSFPFV